MMLAPVVVMLVVQVLASVSARSVTSIALDLIPELESMFASESPFVNSSATNSTPLTPESVDFASNMFAEFLPAIKESMIAQAQAKQRSLDPAVDAQFEKMGKILPRIIRLFGAIATRPKVDPSLEPALQDYTNIGQASGTAANALTKAADQIKEQTVALVSDSKSEISPQASVNEIAVVEEVTSVKQEAPQAAEEVPSGFKQVVVPDLLAYSPNALEGPKVESALVQQAIAPDATAKLNFKFPVPSEVLAAAQASGDGSVHYSLPGGGFFYATGFTG